MHTKKFCMQIQGIRNAHPWLPVLFYSCRKDRLGGKEIEASKGVQEVMKTWKKLKAGIC